MDYTVGLQPSFSYSWFVILLSIAILAAGILVLVYRWKRVREEAGEHMREEVKKQKIPLPQLKVLYGSRVDAIGRQAEEGKLDTRRAYLMLSSAVREFVYEATDIHVQEFTLTEIRKAKLPALEELIGDLYEPEFAERSQADIVKSIRKAKRLIQEWK